MLYSGAGDGVYRTTNPLTGSGESEQVLESGRACRVRQLAGFEGLFAAATDDCYHSLDGETWTPLGAPGDQVLAIGATPDGERLIAGTFPAHLYVLEGYEPDADAAGDPSGSDWRELEGFQELPSRSEWHTPRHDDAAQVRSVCTHRDAPDRVAVGVEVGGVHVSEDRGDAWTERRDGLHDDVHHLQLVGPDEFVAATGRGCYRSTDAGRTWTELSADVEQQYFREALAVDGDVYAGAAHGPSTTWSGGTDAGLFVGRDGGPLQPVASPRPDEVAIGWTVVEGTVVAATNEGTLLAERSGEFEVVGSVPLTDEPRGRYVPLAWHPE